jgi:hypothetical protein
VRRLGVVLALAWCACVDVVQHGVSVPLALETPCNAADAVSADSWRVRAFAGTAQLWERDEPTFPTAIALGSGTDFHLEFEALQGGVIVGRGVSRHFDVVENQPTSEGLLISVRPVGRFVKRCGGLLRARAGHTATLLQDGSVLIVGGLDANGVGLSSMEQLGVVSSTEVGPLGVRVGGAVIELPRAFHSALRLDNGQVLIAGGENVAMSGGPKVVVSTLVVIDPSLGFAQGAVANTAGTWTGRSRHAAFRDGAVALFAGGITRTTSGVTAADTLERFDLGTFTFGTKTTLTSPPDEAGVVFTGEDVVVVGGVVNGAASNQVRFISARGGSARDVQLLTARSLPGVAPVGGRLLVLGGIDASSRYLDRSEWITASGAMPGPFTSARANPCVVPLADGRVFVFGGLSANGPSNLAELISADGNVVSVADPNVPGRVEHTCTLLGDGSVLIAGGRTNAGAASDLWHFAP